MQAAVLAAMRDPAFYGVAGPVEHRETQISHVFLAGDRAYKLKKALVLPFLDYGTLERRRFFCQEEIRLNRPLAPSVYLGVRGVIATAAGLALGDERNPRAVEYVVEMRRFAEADTLAALVRGRSADAALLRRVGTAIADFHAAAPAPADAVGGEVLAERLESDLEQLAAAAGDAHQADVRGAARAARAFVARGSSGLDARARRGLVREGHGDLRLEHVLVGQRIELVDCVEFDPGLRLGNVAYDLAFTVMELHDQGAAALADELTAGYRAAGGDCGDQPLLHGLAACRALVRAKVAALRVPLRPGELDRFLVLARRLFWLARCPLTIVVCGPAGTGKTTLADEIARASGLPHLSSDRVRKARAGVAATDRLQAGGYTPAASRATYRALGQLAREQAERGAGAIVDATFRHTADRAAFDEAFAGAMGGLVVLRLTVPTAVAHARAANRAADPKHVSDAGPDQAVAQAREFAPFEGAWLERAASLDANRPVGELAEEAEAALDACLA